MKIECVRTINKNLNFNIYLVHSVPWQAPFYLVWVGKNWWKPISKYD